MNHETLKEMTSLYALGALDGTDLEAFRSHLSDGCAECEKLVGEHLEAVHLLQQSVAPLMPHDRVKQKLFQKLGLGPKPLDTARFIPAAGMLVSGGILAAALFFWAVPRSAPLVYLPESSGHGAKMQELLSSSEIKKIFLRSSDPGVERYAILAWHPKSCGGCFVVKGLSTLAPGQAYQLWATGKDGKPVSVGTFDVDADGNAHLDFEEMKDKQAFDSFAVSLETAGGSVLPAGPTLLLGRL